MGCLMLKTDKTDDGTKRFTLNTIRLMFADSFGR